MRSFALFVATVAAFAFAPTAPGQVLEPAGLPLPQGKPVESSAPDLLPRSDALPDPAPLYPNLSKDPRPASAVPAPTPALTEEQRRANEQRLAEVRAVAMRNPEAAALLQAANAALSVEAKRNYLRAYYTVVGMRMRRLEPRLAGEIRTFERSRIRAVGRSKDPRVPDLAKE